VFRALQVLPLCVKVFPSCTRTPRWLIEEFLSGKVVVLSARG